MAGTIDPYQTNAGVRYRVRYRKPDGQQTSKRGFKTKRDARFFLSTVDVAKAKGLYIDPTAGKQPVSHFAELWKSGQLTTLKKSSQNTMETTWRVHVLPQWGHRQVASIRTTEITSWLGSLTAGDKKLKKKALAGQTVRRCAFVLSQILELAVADKVIPTNPSRGIRLPAKNSIAKPYLTHLQVEYLALKSTRADLIRFLAYTGLRWGEASALRVRHLDFERRRMSIESNVVLVKGELVFGTPKTNETRIVPMAPFIADLLEPLIENRPPDAFIFGSDTVPLLRPHAEYSWFAGAVKKAMADDTSFPRVTPHDLRHTAASLAVSAGANVKLVQRMLGHKSAAVTLDIYSDLFEQDIDKVAADLSAARAVALALAA